MIVFNKDVRNPKVSLLLIFRNTAVLPSVICQTLNDISRWGINIAGLVTIPMTHHFKQILVLGITFPAIRTNHFICINTIWTNLIANLPIIYRLKQLVDSRRLGYFFGSKLKGC